MWQVDAHEIRQVDAHEMGWVDANAHEMRQAGDHEMRQADTGRPAEAPRHSGRYNLRKRTRVDVHRIWVEEESDSADPVSYDNAVEHPKLGPKWSEAVREELQSLHSNYTWDYIRPEDVPAEVNPISSRWVFKTKQFPGGGIRYKARLVIRGYE